MKLKLVKKMGDSKETTLYPWENQIVGDILE